MMLVMRALASKQYLNFAYVWRVLIQTEIVNFNQFPTNYMGKSCDDCSIQISGTYTQICLRIV